MCQTLFSGSGDNDRVNKTEKDSAHLLAVGKGEGTQLLVNNGE